jgi:hypothetical protein
MTDVLHPACPLPPPVPADRIATARQWLERLLNAGERSAGPAVKCQAMPQCRGAAVLFHRPRK